MAVVGGDYEQLTILKPTFQRESAPVLRLQVGSQLAAFTVPALRGDGSTTEVAGFAQGDADLVTQEQVDRTAQLLQSFVDGLADDERVVVLGVVEMARRYAEASWPTA